MGLFSRSSSHKQAQDLIKMNRKHRIEMVGPEYVEVIMLDGKKGISPAEQDLIARREQRNEERLIQTVLAAQERIN